MPNKQHSVNQYLLTEVLYLTIGYNQARNAEAHNLHGQKRKFAENIREEPLTITFHTDSRLEMISGRNTSGVGLVKSGLRRMLYLHLSADKTNLEKGWLCSELFFFAPF